MNLIQIIANSLNVSIGEKFRVVNKEGVILNYKCKFTDKGVVSQYRDSNVYECNKGIQYGLINGELSIIKLPYEPEFNNTYYYIDEAGKICHTKFVGAIFDYGMILMENAFPTMIDAENNKCAVLKKLRDL